MSGLVGNPRTIAKFAKGLQGLSVRAAMRIAAKAAPVITDAAQASFAARTDPYGQPWREGVDGKPVDLQETGKLRAGLAFYAVGRRIVAKLGTKYAKYQVGKRRVLPPGGRPLPLAWSQSLADIANAEIRAEVEAAHG